MKLISFVVIAAVTVTVADVVAGTALQRGNDTEQGHLTLPPSQQASGAMNGRADDAMRKNVEMAPLGRGVSDACFKALKVACIAPGSR